MIVVHIRIEIVIRPYRHIVLTHLHHPTRCLQTHNIQPMRDINKSILNSLILILKVHIKIIILNHHLKQLIRNTSRSRNIKHLRTNKRLSRTNSKHIKPIKKNKKRNRKLISKMSIKSIKHTKIMRNTNRNMLKISIIRKVILIILTDVKLVILEWLI